MKYTPYEITNFVSLGHFDSSLLLGDVRQATDWRNPPRNRIVASFVYHAVIQSRYPPPFWAVTARVKFNSQTPQNALPEFLSFAENFKYWVSYYKNFMDFFLQSLRAFLQGFLGWENPLPVQVWTPWAQIRWFLWETCDGVSAREDKLFERKPIYWKFGDI